MSKFVRPENLSIPQIYYTFKARDKNSDRIVEYRVQDLPESFYDKALDLIVEHFLPEETFCSCKKIYESPESVQAIRGFYKATLSNKLAIACFKKGNDDELVGVNVLVVKSKNEEKSQADFGEKVAEIFASVEVAIELFDVYKHYSIDKYLFALGLCINPIYRGRGIATEMLKARAPILKALGLTVTSTAFTAIGSQIAARKAGYDEVFSISYDELETKIPNYDFSQSSTRTFKILAMKI